MSQRTISCEFVKPQAVAFSGECSHEEIPVFLACVLRIIASAFRFSVCSTHTSLKFQSPTAVCVSVHSSSVFVFSRWWSPFSYPHHPTLTQKQPVVHVDSLSIRFPPHFKLYFCALFAINVIFFLLWEGSSELREHFLWIFPSYPPCWNQC